MKRFRWILSEFIYPPQQLIKFVAWPRLILVIKTRIGGGGGEGGGQGER